MKSVLQHATEGQDEHYQRSTQQDNRSGDAGTSRQPDSDCCRQSLEAALNTSGHKPNDDDATTKRDSGGDDAATERALHRFQRWRALPAIFRVPAGLR